MGQSLKQIRNRIRSIASTRKVTQAMQMVSVAKLNRIDRALVAIRPYFTALESIVTNLVAGQAKAPHPLFIRNIQKDTVILGVITSDSGLCGMYNHEIISRAEEFIRQRGSDKVKLVCIGKKGWQHFKKYPGAQILKSYLGLNGRYNEAVTKELADYLVSKFISGQASEVYLAYTHYQTAFIHRPTLVKLLHLEFGAPKKQERYLLEPDLNAILEEIAPKYIQTKLKFLFLEAFATEHAARTIAMKTATENAADLLEKLELWKNKIRQANITQEIMEIVSSSEALKG